MGCPASKQMHEEKEDPRSQLVVLAKRLSVEFRMQIQKLEGELKIAIQQLRGQIHKEQELRSKQREEQILQNIVYKSHLKLIYQAVDLQCQSIQDKANYMSVLRSRRLSQKVMTAQQQSALKAVLVPIQNLLFAMDLIHDGKINRKNTDLQKFSSLISSKYTMVTPIEKSRHDVINYYKTHKKPDHEMLKQYAFIFCNEEKVPLTVLNSSGHNFHY